MSTALPLKFDSAFPLREEWERLPWLFDVPARRRRPWSGWVLAALIALISSDAVASYAAGALSVRAGMAAVAYSQPAPRDGPNAIALRLADAQSLGWHRRRANAAY